MKASVNLQIGSLDREFVMNDVLGFYNFFFSFMRQTNTTYALGVDIRQVHLLCAMPVKERVTYLQD